MNSQEAYHWIARSKVVAGMRGNFPPETALKLARLLMEYDITAFELTMNSVQPIEAMQMLKRELGDSALVGMGTVLNPDDARRVLDAGADFVVSPAFQPEVVEVVLSADVLVAPGVITPSEAVAAWGMGVQLLKLFPIGSLGLGYFKAMFGPLNHMKFICNGGMTAENAEQFFKAGAVAAGMADWLSGDGSTPEMILRGRAAQMQNAVRAANGAIKQGTV